MASWKSGAECFMKESRWLTLRRCREIEQDVKEPSLELCRWRVQVPLTSVSSIKNCMDKYRSLTKKMEGAGM